jgi:hypothetical protein
MLKKTFLLTILIAIVLFQACKKNNDTPAGSSASFPKTYTEDVRLTGYNSVTTYNLSYDGNNRMISMTAIPEPAIIKFIYNYTSGNSFTMDLYNSNVLSIHEVSWLNSFSFLDSTFQYNDSGDSSTEKYVYNTAKQLVQLNTYNYTSAGSVLYQTTNYTYDDTGNAVLESDTQGGSASYTYYTDLPNTLSMGQSFLPLSKNLIRTATSSSSGTPITATHYYSFDGSNRLVKDSAVTTGVDATVIKSYTY